MYVTLVFFPGRDLPEEEMEALLKEAAPAYQAIPGLVRKYFIGDGQGRGGGIYQWRSRAHAEAYWTPARIAGMEARYGAPVEVTHCPMSGLVDNETHRIAIDVSER